MVNAADVQAYGALWVFAREAQDVILRVGTDDGGKACGTAKELFDNRICRGSTSKTTNPADHRAGFASPP